MQMDKLHCRKTEFSLPEGVHYLNCAYMSPLSKRVEAAGMAGILRKSNPTALVANDFFTETDEVRALFAKLVNAPTDSISIIPSASYGVATVAKNLQLKPSQNIVLLAEQFPSNVYSWRQFAEQGVTLKTISAPSSEKRAETWNEALLNAIDDATAVVALEHIHWTDGTLFDLEAISKQAREVGAALIIDATQSVGALPFDVKKIQPDALIVAGYKTMMGPYSIGCAYYGERFATGLPLEEGWITRQDSENFAGLVDYTNHYSQGMSRYDMGERSNFILMPMLKAALEDILERDPVCIQSYCHDLSRDFVEVIVSLGYSVEAEAFRAKHLFGVRLPKHVDLDSLQASLKANRIFASVRGTALRVSTNVYNDAADIAALQKVLTEALS